MSISSPVLIDTNLPLPPFVRGKVRDTYDLGKLLLIIATDRISAFDSVLPCGIPNKGLVLNRLSVFWFQKTEHLMPNHLVEAIDDVNCLDNYLPATSRFPYPAYLEGRSMIVKKVERLPIECVVRGYLSGSAWTEYQEKGTIYGELLPEGLQESQELPQPLFTPTTKEETGHDRPLSMNEMKNMVGGTLAEELKDKSLAIYSYAREYAQARDIIIADTKMEFGLEGNKLILIDELLTPDSSRLWDAKLYIVGKSQPSYDKQPVRDWLVESGWNKEPPAPMLPPEVIEATTKRYRQAYERLTGRKLREEKGTMITEQDVRFLFEDLWPRMNRAGLHKKRCLAQFDQISEQFQTYQSDFNQLLIILKEIKYIGWVIASGLIFSANRDKMVPFDSNTTGWAIEKGIIPNNKISANYVNYSSRIVDYIRNSPHLNNIVNFVREANQTIKPIAPE